MTSKNIRIKLQTCNEINELMNQGIKEQWTASEFFKNIYCPILLNRTYTKQVDSYLHGWYDAGMHVIWHTMMNPISMTNEVTWKSTNKVFSEETI